MPNAPHTGENHHGSVNHLNKLNSAGWFSQNRTAYDPLPRAGELDMTPGDTTQTVSCKLLKERGVNEGGVKSC